MGEELSFSSMWFFSPEMKSMILGLDLQLLLWQTTNSCDSQYKDAATTLCRTAPIVNQSVVFSMKLVFRMKLICKNIF